MYLALTRPPLPWVAPGSLLALLAFLVAALHPVPLLVTALTAALGAALVLALALAAPWRRFHAAPPAARTAFIGS